MTSLLLSLASMVYRQGELTELWVIKKFQELRIIEKNNTVCLLLLEKDQLAFWQESQQ